jgi:hypothetical protein
MTEIDAQARDGAPVRPRQKTGAKKGSGVLIAAIVVLVLGALFEIVWAISYWFRG